MIDSYLFARVKQPLIVRTDIQFIFNEFFQHSYHSSPGRRYRNRQAGVNHSYLHVHDQRLAANRMRVSISVNVERDLFETNTHLV